MKVKCPISGIKYTAEFFHRGAPVHPHPIFAETVTAGKINDWYLSDWQDGKLSATETHLLGMSLLCKFPINSLGLPELTDSQLTELQKLWNANLERLSYCARKLDDRKWKLKGLPQINVTLESLSNLPSWISDVRVAIDTYSAPITDKARELNRAQYKVTDNQAGRNVAAMLEPEQVDSLVTRALKGSPLSAGEQKALPVILSDWANKVTEFPGHTKMRWQKLVQLVFAPDFINQILMSDMNAEQVKAFEEHMLLNTPAEAVGTSHSTLIMRRLGEVIPVLEDFNPVISKRRKVDEAELTAALFGDEVPAKQADTQSAVGAIGGGTQSSEPAQSTTKPMSLAERLAARLGRKPQESN